MNHLEPTLPATLLAIAMFLMTAGVLHVVCGWAPTDDTEQTTDQSINQPWSIEE